MKIRIGILANELEDDHQPWIDACSERTDEIDFRVVRLTHNSWLKDISGGKFDLLLAKPGGVGSAMKQLYDERIYILVNSLGYRVFPGAEEIFIYENKRFHYSWLEANGVRLAATSVFYDREEAKGELKNFKFPMVAKMNIGASGRGFRLIGSIKEAEDYINMAFSKGITTDYGPNWRKDSPLKKIMNLVRNPGHLKKRVEIYKIQRREIQKGYVIFQEYIEHDFEWRLVRIGESFFAHKKLKDRGIASGSLEKDYADPPIEIFDFVKDLTDRFGFRSMAVDMFEIAPGSYVVNEMQCIFGQSDAYQMLVGGKPGRYRKVGKEWKFEEGDFMGIMGYRLRLDYILGELRKER